MRNRAKPTRSRSGHIASCPIIPPDRNAAFDRRTERAEGEIHRCYRRMVNFREAWRGHLWQGRFAPFVLDELNNFAQRLIPLSTFRREERPCVTQHPRPAGGPALKYGIVN